MKKLISLALFVLGLQAGQNIAVTQEQQKSLGLKTSQVVSAKSLSFGPFNGRVSLDKKDLISLGFGLDAIVEEIYVRQYQRVEEGEKLLSVSSYALLDLQNDYLSVLLEEENLAEILARDTKLFSKGLISQKRLSKARKESSESSLKRQHLKNKLLLAGFTPVALKSLEKERISKRRLDIFSPKAGVINAIESNVGAFVQAQQPLLSLYADGKRYLEIVLPLRAAALLKAGDLCTFEGHSASITYVSNLVDPSSQSLQARALIEETDEVLINTVYEVRVVKKIEKAFVITKSSLVFHENSPRIFKKTAHGFEGLSAEIIFEDANSYTIKADLKEGDALASSATSALLGAMEGENE
ncbi:MAG: efflux RND transporter periplasmic adaptor subunit [Campylobacterales bacterium]|nr:efflux RND transporter periplasmic adaptor subunit [Campylobacterales bacterium]